MNRLVNFFCVFLFIISTKLHGLCEKHRIPKLSEDPVKDLQLKAEKKCLEYEFQHGDETSDILTSMSIYIWSDDKEYKAKITQRPIVNAKGKCTFLERTIVVKHRSSGALVFQKTFQIKRDFKYMLKKGADVVGQIVFFPITLLCLMTMC